MDRSTSSQAITLPSRISANLNLSKPSLREYGYQRFVHGAVASGQGGWRPKNFTEGKKLMAYLGIDPAGVQAWQGTLNSAHEQVISALNNYRTIAQQNNEVAHGSHFQSINSQCEDITNKHLTDHNDLHEQYTKASTDLVRGIEEVAGA
jgi:hypothetical protein